MQAKTLSLALVLFLLSTANAETVVVSADRMFDSESGEVFGPARIVVTDGVIESVTPEWLSFARENQAQHLSSDAVVGQPLLNFVTCHITRELYAVIIDRVRETRQAVVLPFRCDGPSVRRFMELDIRPDDGGRLRFAARTIREEQREAVPFFDPDVERTEAFVTVCSWCKRVWLPVPS